MPYQLVCTSAARSSDSARSGHGIVARSADMPEELAQRLAELSEYKEPAEQGILGAQFTYRIESIAGRTYHILTGSRPAEKDTDAQFSRTIAHHIAISEEEVQQIIHGEFPATPAGLILAFELHHLWLNHRERQSALLPASSPLPVELCPGAEQQPTWVIFSGSRNNSRAFHTAPFDKGVVALVPLNTRSRDILRLLHESDYLSPTLGWGKGFCTYSDTAALSSSDIRLFTVAGSSLHRCALHAHVPLLDIRPGLVISATAHQDTAEQESASPIPPLEPLPYKYVESDDAHTFEKTAACGPKRKRLTPLLPLLILLIGGCAIIGALRYAKSPTPEPTAQAAKLIDEPAQATAASAPAPAPQPTIEHTPLPLDREAEPAPDTAPPAPTSLPPAASSAGKPEISLVGKRLNSALKLPGEGEETILTQGDFILHTFDAKTGAITSSHRIALSAERSVLISREAEQAFCITPMEGELPAAETPQVTLTLKKGIIQSLTTHNGSPAAVQLPLESGASVILLPELCHRFRADAKSTWPKEKEALNIIFTEGMLITEANELKLTLRVKSLPSWVRLLGEQESVLSPTHSLQLPDFGVSNRIALAPATDDDTSYACAIEPTETAQLYSCTVTQSYNFRRAVRKKFRSFVNASPDGTPKNFNLGALYRLISEMNNAKAPENRDRLIDIYAGIYRHARVDDLLRRSVFNGLEPLIPTKEEAAKYSPSRRASKELRARLADPHNRALLLQALHSLFARQIQAAYGAEREKAITQTPVFTLQLSQVELQADGALLWVFRFTWKSQH